MGDTVLIKYCIHWERNADDMPVRLRPGHPQGIGAEMARKPTKPTLKDALRRQQERERTRSREKRAEEAAGKRLRERSDYLKEVLAPVHYWTDGASSRAPLRSDSVVLVVGDGDLSYSRALSLLLSNNACVIPTVYDQEEELYSKYPQAAAHVKALGAAPNVWPSGVMFGVDARTIDKLRGLPRLDVVVFHFPHTGSGIKDRARNIRGNQEVLMGFFSACASLFAGYPKAADAVSYTSSLAAASAATDTAVPASSYPKVPEVQVTLKLGDPYDDWNVKSLAKAAGFHSIHAFKFVPSLYSGYAHCRTDGGREDRAEFDHKAARTTVFRMAEPGKTQRHMHMHVAESKPDDDDE